MNLPEATPWYVALVVVLMGAALTALRPLFGWAQREYDRHAEHRRALERAQIEEMRNLSDAVGKLTCVVEGLQATVESMHSVLIAIYSPERLRELAWDPLQGERASSPEKGKRT